MTTPDKKPDFSNVQTTVTSTEQIRPDFSNVQTTVTSTRWDSPAFNAGVVTGARIVAVGGTAYDQDRLKLAITAAKGGNQPIDLLIRRGDRFVSAPVQWNGGLRWPWLERAAPGKTPVPLDLLLAPRRVARCTAKIPSRQSRHHRPANLRP